MATTHLRPNCAKKQPQALFSGDAIELTSSWQDVGQEFNVKGVEKVVLWLDVDINLSENVRIRVLGKQSRGASNEFNLPIQSPYADNVAVDDQYFELAVDADQKVVLEITLNKSIQYIQVQVQDSNNSTGQIESASVSFI